MRYKGPGNVIKVVSRILWARC